MNDTANITTNVMNEIQEKRIKMRPKAYFIAGSVLLAAGLTFVLTMAVFVVNLISFRLRMDVPLEFLQFGRPGVSPFFVVFPWVFFLLALAAIFFGLKLMRKYELSYKHNFLALAAVIISSVIFAGVLIDRAGVNEHVAKIEPLANLYHEVVPDERWLAGEIIAAGDESLQVKTWDGRKITVVFDRATMFPAGRLFRAGLRVRTFGEWQGGVLKAKGITVSRFVIRPTFYPRLPPPF